MPPAEQTAAAHWEAARHALAEAVRHASDEPRVRRVETVAPASAGLLAWLARQPAPRGFWQGRGGPGRKEAACAFAGVAERFEDPARLCARLFEAPSGPPLRYYGGVRFDPERPAAGGWQRFGSGAFVLPRLELTRPAEGPPRLACHLAPDDDLESVRAQVEQMPLPPGATGEDAAWPAPTRRRDCPAQPAWTEAVRAALRVLGNASPKGASPRGASLQKVVLARRTTFRLDAPLAPARVLRRLRAHVPGGFAFLIQPRAAGAFLGVSPERLFRQRGRTVESEAVAGTRPRAAGAAEDAALRDELLGSDKDRREHAFVQRYVAGALRPLCASLGKQEAAPLALPYGRHLRARFRGQLREGVTPADVLRALHPTPAVGGVPPEAARPFIREHEPFDRGWYAAPVGWIGRAQSGALAADLAVGIRSGLVREGGRRLDLFAGAGLVEGSAPAEEWDEVEQKLNPFTALFEERRRTVDD